MSNVYFIPLSENCPDTISAAARKLLEHLVEQENIPLSASVPLKVHFGEKFNRTYIKSENYAGIRDFLAGKGIQSCYIETSVLYGGERFERSTACSVCGAAWRRRRPDGSFLWTLRCPAAGSD